MVACSLVADTQTHTDKKAKTKAALSGLSEFLTSAHHQGAVQYEFGGLFKRVKTCPNGPKVTFLLIKTYFLEYLRPERSPAARRSTCFIIYVDLLEKFQISFI